MSVTPPGGGWTSRLRSARLPIAVLIGVGVGLELDRLGLMVAAGPGIATALLGGGALLLMTSTDRRRRPERSVDRDDEDHWAEFRREFRRSRRHARPLTLIRVPGDAIRGGTLHDAVTGDRDLHDWTRELTRNLRLIDRAWIDEGSVYLLLPESTRTAATVLLDRLRDSGLHVPDVRTACFPEDGLTTGAIVAAVHDAIVQPVPIALRTAPAGDEDARATEVPPVRSMSEVAGRR
jgi:hypothetical protein